MRVAVVLAALVACSALAAAAPWGYKGAFGPQFWASLGPGYDRCDLGLKQSPVNIVAAQTNNDLEPIEFHYQARRVELWNNGHSMELDFRRGSYIEANGKRYQLNEAYFHTPAEHHVRGLIFPMELQLYHRADNGEYAVVSVLFVQGRENQELAKFWDKLPEQSTTFEDRTILPDIKVLPEALLPEKRGYFAYEGSLTTPPCTEGLKWYIMNDYVHASEVQIAKILSIFEANARPTQPMNRRIVQHCPHREGVPVPPSVEFPPAVSGSGSGSGAGNSNNNNNNNNTVAKPTNGTTPTNGNATSIADTLLQLRAPRESRVLRLLGRLRALRRRGLSNYGLSPDELIQDTAADKV